MLISVARSPHFPSKASLERLSQVAAIAFCPILLVLQPILFFRHVLINPTEHIPYDIEGFHLPLIAYIAKCARQNVFPLWDPYSLGGVPIHADPQAQVFYPLTWLAVFAGNLSHGRYLFYWIEAMVPLHMALGGLFAFLLLRRMGLTRPAALMGASIYQLGGFFASQAQHLGAICTGAWLPLAILAMFELRHRLRPRWIAVLGIAIAMSILSGFAATTLVVAGAALLVLAGWLLAREASWRLIPGTAAGFLLGAAIAAVEVIPLWILTQASVASERARYTSLGGGLHIEILASLLVPNYYHVFDAGGPLYKLPYDFTLLYAYCGMAAVILIAVAPFVRRRIATLFLALTVVSVLWMLGEHTPVYRAIYVLLPGLLRGALYAEYALLAFCFFAAITAAIVLDRLGNRLPPALFWGIALFTSYDLIHAGADRPMNTYSGGHKTEASPYRADAEAVAARLRTVTDQTRPPSRVDYTDEGFGQGIEGPGMLDIPTTAGDNPFALLRVMHVRRLYAAGEEWSRNLTVNRVDSPLLRMLNVALLAGVSPIPEDAIRRAGLEVLPPERGVRIYRNPRALPRFFLVRSIRKSSGETETLRLLSREGFDPAEEAIVEGLSADLGELATTGLQLNSYQTNRIHLTVAVDRPAFLATSEVMYPGWEATVNDAPQALLLTNGAFRGLTLEAGKNRIVMEYHPRGLALSLSLSLLALATTLAALVNRD